MTTRKSPPSKRKAKPDAPEALRKTVRLLVAGIRQEQDPDDETIRAAVKATLREAIEDDDEWAKFVAVPGDQPIPIAGGAVLFRLVFFTYGLDRADPRAQERWYGIVDDATTDALRTVVRRP